VTRSDGRPSVRLPRIAVDLLGGDRAPAVVVDGALRACGTDHDLELLLVGPRSAADEVLAAAQPGHRDRITVAVASRGVRMTDPVTGGADRRTSIGVAMAALRTGRVDAVVSAGATGAIVTASVMALGRADGVRRPALAATLPGRGGPTVLLDVGAGMQASPADLIQHAFLGATYAHLVGGVARPRVGLLTVGAEPGKGDRLRRSVDAALRTFALPGQARYRGPVEGGDVVTGDRADVVVTDGFTGNVLLKGVEAALAAAASKTPPTAVARAASLLGVRGAVVVCHGAADGRDICSGIALAAMLVRSGLIGAIGALGRAATRAREGAGLEGAGLEGAGLEGAGLEGSRIERAGLESAGRGISIVDIARSGSGQRG
jgi:phosphate acyltransferase